MGENQHPNKAEGNKKHPYDPKIDKEWKKDRPYINKERVKRLEEAERDNK